MLPKIIKPCVQYNQITCSFTVIDKIFIASEKFGLERNRENAKIIYKDIDKNLDIEFAPHAYEKFLETFTDKLA